MTLPMDISISTDPIAADAAAPLSAIWVVAGALIEKNTGEVLIAKRPAMKALAGLWEFPGGKIEAGETPLQALRRELSEEIGVEIQLNAAFPVNFTTYVYERFIITVLLFRITDWVGTPVAIEHQEIDWLPVNDLKSVPLTPASHAFAALL